MKLCVLLSVLIVPLLAQRPVLVVSIDGLDARYLNECDRLKLKIPHLRRLMKEGQWAQGVIGVVPTVTWPSHTTLISGVSPDVHGILGNRRPREEGGDYYWSAKLLKAHTLLDAVTQSGKTTAAITWPVTVDAPVTYNLPEFFVKRRGGAMDLPSIASKATPADLVSQISAIFPSFAQEWMDDRTRTLATQYLLRKPKPDLILVHFVDLDSEAHDNGPFTPQANAILEYTDELIGRMLADLPPEYAFVLVSDHGFERLTREINLHVIATAAGVKGVRSMGGVAIAETEAAKTFLQKTSGVGREIPLAEASKLSSRLSKAVAVFEPADGVWFGSAASGEPETKPHELGAHGHWPSRYRSVYLAWGRGIKPERLPELPMTEIAGRLASLLKVTFHPGPK